MLYSLAGLLHIHILSKNISKLTHFFTDGLDTDFLLGIVAEVVEQDVLPVRPVRDQSKVGQWFLRTPDLPLVLRQKVGEVDEEPTIAFALKEEKVICLQEFCPKANMKLKFL